MGLGRVLVLWVFGFGFRDLRVLWKVGGEWRVVRDLMRFTGFVVMVSWRWRSREERVARLNSGKAKDSRPAHALVETKCVAMQLELYRCLKIL